MKKSLLAGALGAMVSLAAFPAGAFANSPEPIGSYPTEAACMEAARAHPGDGLCMGDGPGKYNLYIVPTANDPAPPRPVDPRL